ncbi:hypothetical protein [Tabrizicola sp.]|uniref:hypothetical protein n=1 Tax=Tabrizicola sp. TaxID=2005166 RepID=UPI0035244065
MTAKPSPTQIAWRAAQGIGDGVYVSLGIGCSEMVAKFQPPGRQVPHTLRHAQGRHRLFPQRRNP